MTLHPHHLHALAACWSLRAAWPRLLAAQQAATAAAAADQDRGTLQAWRPGSGVHSGTSGDALLDAVIRHADAGTRNLYSDRVRLTQDTLTWAASAVLGPTFSADTGGILDQLMSKLPTLTPTVAQNLTLWIDEQDRAIRHVLRDPDDRRLLPGIDCPACGASGSLALRQSAPLVDQVVVCTQAPCVCAGPDCRCGMGITHTDVHHIWTRTQIKDALAR